jgi:hypothetical protein
MTTRMRRCVGLPHRAKPGTASVSLGKELVKCRLQAIEIGGVVVTLERHSDEAILSPLEDRDLDSMFVVEALLEILRRILRYAERDHLPEELLGVGRQRLETQLVAGAARELVTAFAHRVPLGGVTLS